MAPYSLKFLISRNPTGSFGDSGSGYGRNEQQLGHTEEIVCAALEEGGQFGPRNPLISGLAKPAGDLHPTKDFFHPLANPLTDLIRLKPGRSAINGLSSSPFGNGCYMGNNSPGPQGGHKIPGVIPVVAPKVLGLIPRRACRLNITNAASLSVTPTDGMTIKYNSKPCRFSIRA